MLRDQVHYMLLPEDCWRIVIHCCTILPYSIIIMQVYSVKYETLGPLKFLSKFSHNYKSKGYQPWKIVFAILYSQIAAKALLLQIQKITCSLICVIFSLVLKVCFTLVFVKFPFILLKFFLR